MCLSNTIMSYGDENREDAHNVAKTLLKLNLNSSIFKCSRESYWTFHSRPDYILKNILRNHRGYDMNTF